MHIPKTQTIAMPDELEKLLAISAAAVQQVANTMKAVADELTPLTPPLSKLTGYAKSIDATCKNIFKQLASLHDELTGEGSDRSAVAVGLITAGIAAFLGLFFKKFGPKIPVLNKLFEQERKVNVQKGYGSRRAMAARRMSGGERAATSRRPTNRANRLPRAKGIGVGLGIFAALSLADMVFASSANAASASAEDLGASLSAGAGGGLEMLDALNMLSTGLLLANPISLFIGGLALLLTHLDEVGAMLQTGKEKLDQFGRSMREAVGLDPDGPVGTDLVEVEYAGKKYQMSRFEAARMPGVNNAGELPKVGRMYGGEATVPSVTAVDMLSPASGTVASNITENTTHMGGFTFNVQSTDPYTAVQEISNEMQRLIAAMIGSQR